MRIHDKLDEVLRHKSKIKILRFLFAERDEHTGRAIAKDIGMSASSTYKSLQEMRGEGLIVARRKGNAILYRLQENNYIVKKLLEPLFHKEKSMYDDTISFIKKSLLQQKRKIISIAIFGSVARKEEGPRSDIDLLIIVKDEAGRANIDKIIDKLSVEMAKKFWTAISPYILTKSEIVKKHAKGQPLVKSILENNQLVYGEPIERVLA